MIKHIKIRAYYAHIGHIGVEVVSFVGYDYGQATNYVADTVMIHEETATNGHRGGGFFNREAFRWDHFYLWEGAKYVIPEDRYPLLKAAVDEFNEKHKE